MDRARSGARRDPNGTNTLNPLLARDVPELDVEGAIFDGLVKLDDRATRPDLAIEVPTRANRGIAADG